MTLFEKKTLSGQIEIIGKVYQLPTNSKFEFANYSLIEQDEIGRFDKTAFRLTEDDNNWDRLMKTNGIQDPFNDFNNFVIVASPNYLADVFVDKVILNLSSNKQTNSLTVNNSVISVVSKDREIKISKILYKFGETATELRKPIYLKSNEEPLTLNNGLISTNIK